MPDTIADAVDDRAYPRETSPRKGRTTRGLVIRFVLMALALLVVIGGLYGFNRFREKAIANFFANNKPPPAPVSVAEAKAEAMPQKLPAIGGLAAVHQVTVSPEVGGRVVQIFFQAGASVKAGDPLVQLNDKPEQGDLANYQAQAKLAQVNLARAKELASRQYGPQATVDQYQSQLEEANAGIAKTQSLIQQKLIKAPFDGQLGIRQIEVGQYLNPGGAIVTLTDLAQLYVNFTLPEQNRGRVAVGQTVRVAVDAYPGRTFEGKITTIEPQISADTRMIKVQATMDNPEHLLLPGMFANVEVVLQPRPDVITVPETAVDYTLYGDSVFVVRQEGTDAQGKPALKAVRTSVKTGERFAHKVAILSGLQPGDRVVVTGQNRLTNEAPVAIAENGPLPTPTQIPTN